jgi:predicted CopG family antitoxin
MPAPKGAEEDIMANLQVKGIDDDLYDKLKKLALNENRSISQEIIFLIKTHLSVKKTASSSRTPAEILLQLSGSWDDQRTADEIIAEIRNHHKNSERLQGGL